LLCLAHHLVDNDELITSWRHQGVWHAAYGLHSLLDSFKSRYYGALQRFLTSLFPDYRLLTRGYCPLSLLVDGVHLASGNQQRMFSRILRERSQSYDFWIYSHNASVVVG
jgi:hypothetical protein